MSEDTPPFRAPESTTTNETAPADASIMKDRLAAAQKERDALLERLQYLQADFENLQKRAARSADALVKVGHEALLARLLPVLDDFDAALANAEGESSKGLRMIHANLVKALTDAGLQDIPAEGAAFDPYVHECLQWVPEAGSPDGTVKEVVRKGYRLQDRILRPAQVIVIRNGDEPNA